MKNLIVEGFGDKVFFEKYCEHHAFNVDVRGRLRKRKI